MANKVKLKVLKGTQKGIDNQLAHYSGGQASKGSNNNNNRVGIMSI
jgi:hypothetical protein